MTVNSLVNRTMTMQILTMITRKSHVVTSILVQLGIAISFSTSLFASTLSRDKAIEFWAKSLENQDQRLSKIDEALSIQIDSAEQIQLNEDSGFDLLRQKMDALLDTRQELLSKRQVIENILSIVRAHYTGQPLKPFLQLRITNWISFELGLGQNTFPNRDGLVPLLLGMKVFIQNSASDHELLFLALEKYLEKQSFDQPKNPLSFIENQDYSNVIEGEKVLLKSSDVLPQ